MPERRSKTSTVPVAWANLEFFRYNPNHFLSRLVTTDETCLYHYNPETKQQLMEWLHSGSSCPKKFWVQKSAGKVLALISWDQDSIFHTDYLPKRQTINVEYYSSLRRGKVTKGVFFLRDNAPAHQALVTQKKLAYLGIQCLDHPPYSLDLAPSDYHLFPGLKKTIETSPFFVRRGGHCCRRDLVGWTTFWIFFKYLAKVRAMG